MFFHHGACLDPVFSSMAPVWILFFQHGPCFSHHGAFSSSMAPARAAAGVCAESCGCALRACGAACCPRQWLLPPVAGRPHWNALAGAAMVPPSWRCATHARLQPPKSAGRRPGAVVTTLCDPCLASTCNPPARRSLTRSTAPSTSSSLRTWASGGLTLAGGPWHCFQRHPALPPDMGCKRRAFGGPGAGRAQRDMLGTAAGRSGAWRGDRAGE